MIKSLAARTLSARQKSTIRSLAYRFGAYAPRQVEQLVESIVVKDGAKTFLQIGANDGYLSDPLNLAIYRLNLTGTLVEPQPNYSRELRNTYAKFPGMNFVQCAISDAPGTMTMYTLDCSSGRLPRWAHGVGTLSREQILKFGDQIADIEHYVRTTHVECITVQTLLERMPTRDPDIIVVDAEGFDHAILSQFDFSALSTKLVIYETESMASADAAALARTLTAAGFMLLDADQDTVALRRNTRTARALPEAAAQAARAA